MSLDVGAATRSRVMSHCLPGLNERMQSRVPPKKIAFTFSPTAQERLSTVVPAWIGQTLKKGLVPILSYDRGERRERQGRVVWEYSGPQLGMFGQRPEALRNGHFYDLFGFQVWIAESEYLLLKGKTLTFTKVGGPEPKERLVIESTHDGGD